MAEESVLDPKRLTCQLFRLVGYGLLLLSSLDLLSTFIPLRLLNPDWEVQVISALADRVAAPLIGLALVFYQGLHTRTKLEISLLKGVSWAALGAGILYFLLIPLLIVNSFRLNTTLVSQNALLIQQRMAQVEQVSSRLSRATSKEELATLFTRFSGQPLDTALSAKPFPELKQELLTTLEKAKPTARQEAETLAAERRTTLLKTTLKAFLGCVIAGICLVYAWHLTRGVRRYQVAPQPPPDSTDLSY